MGILEKLFGKEDYVSRRLKCVDESRFTKPYIIKAVKDVKNHARFVVCSYYDEVYLVGEKRSPFVVFHRLGDIISDLAAWTTDSGTYIECIVDTTNADFETLIRCLCIKGFEIVNGSEYEARFQQLEYCEKPLLWISFWN